MALEETLTIENEGEGGGKFCLKSAIQWIGSSGIELQGTSGHYISYVKDNRGQWWKANDQLVDK